MDEIPAVSYFYKIAYKIVKTFPKDSPIGDKNGKV